MDSITHIRLFYREAYIKQILLFYTTVPIFDYLISQILDLAASRLGFQLAKVFSQSIAKRG